MDKFLVKRKLSDKQNSMNAHRNMSQSSSKANTLELKWKSAPVVKKIKVDAPQYGTTLNPFALKTKSVPAPNCPNHAKPQVQSKLSLLHKLDRDMDMLRAQQAPPSPMVFRSSLELDAAINDSVSRQVLNGDDEYRDQSSHELGVVALPPESFSQDDEKSNSSDAMKSTLTNGGDDSEQTHLMEQVESSNVLGQWGGKSEGDHGRSRCKSQGPTDVETDRPGAICTGTSLAQTSIEDFLQPQSSSEDANETSSAITSQPPSARPRYASSASDAFGGLVSSGAVSSVFIRDPVAYSHPLRLSRRSRAALVASHFDRSDVQVQLSLQGDGGHHLIPKGVGCTCIRFDKDGVLFVAGGSNGVVRLFDFDDVLFASSRASRISRPAVPELTNGQRR